MSKIDSRRDARAQKKWGLESSSSGYPSVMRFTGAHAPDFLSLSPRLCPSARDICCMNAAYTNRVPRRCRAMETDKVFVGGRGSVAPAGAGCAWGDGTQRSRAGLSSAGPSGLGPRLWRARACRGASGSDPVALFEFSIPMPIPIPIPKGRGSRGCLSPRWGWFFSAFGSHG
jgi:hypothetical protein